MSVLPPAVTVHGLGHARVALAAAAARGRPVLLLSGPGAGGYAGALWWRGVVAAALDGRPGLDALDCGDQAGRALEALAAGCGIVVLGPCPGFAAVAERGGTAMVLGRRPESLDLAVRGAERFLGEWLG
jgi:hypothetical protein